MFRRKVYGNSPARFWKETNSQLFTLLLINAATWQRTHFQSLRSPKAPGTQENSTTFQPFYNTTLNHETQNVPHTFPRIAFVSIKTFQHNGCIFQTNLGYTSAQKEVRRNSPVPGFRTVNKDELKLHNSFSSTDFPHSLWSLGTWLDPKGLAWFHLCWKWGGSWQMNLHFGGSLQPQLLPSSNTQEVWTKTARKWLYLHGWD